MPLHLQIDSIGVDAAVLAYTAEHAMAGRDGITGQPCYQDDVIVCTGPPSPHDVYWQQGGLHGVVNGDMPGMASRGTVYFYGHAGVRGTGAVFDSLPALTPGATAQVTTINGELTYRVIEVFTVPKDRFTTDPRIITQVPGQLLLVSCDHSSGATTTAGGYATDNVIAQLQIEQAGPKTVPVP